MLQPWRIALAAGSQAVIEMAAGSLEWGKVMPGDRLFLAPVSATEAAKEEAGFSSPRMRSLKNAPPVNGFVRRLRDTAGTSIVEAAIITPLLLLLTLSIVDFGALFYCYLALENGVSQATRFAVTGNLLDDPSNPGTNLSRDASIKLAMRQATPTLTLPDSAFTFSSMPPGGTAWGPGSGGPNALAKVSVSYTWTFFNPMLWAFFSGGQITLNVESAMKNEGAPPS
jgi:Flp pilus assembly protein TadG